MLGVGLAIAGCFFPPLELAAGASFEAALAASAGTAFVAADASLAIGVGINLAVAEVHPSPANQAVVVGDLVGLALGYGIGKAIGAAVSKFGPAVVEAFAQRAVSCACKPVRDAHMRQTLTYAAKRSPTSSSRYCTPTPATCSATACNPSIRPPCRLWCSMTKPTLTF